MARILGLALVGLVIWVLVSLDGGRSTTSECHTAGPFDQYEIDCEYDPVVEDAVRDGQRP